MQAIISTEIKEQIERGTVLTVGNFDGVHRGHRAIIDEVCSAAKLRKLTSIAVTFEPHPVTLFRKIPPDQLRLSTTEQRAQRLKDAGINLVLTVPFTREFAATDPKVFIHDFLIHQLRARAIRVGYDFNFGKGRVGNVQALQAVAKESDVITSIHEAVLHEKTPISSTRVRKALKKGKIHEVNKLLGRHFSILGEVEKGHGRGRKMGIPTVNIYPKNVLLPPFGVYVSRLITRSVIKKHAWPSITNIGIRPTFTKDDRISVETLVLNPFNGINHGDVVEIELLSFIRLERSFESKDSLLKQIQKDLILAREIHFNTINQTI